MRVAYVVYIAVMAAAAHTRTGGDLVVVPLFCVGAAVALSPRWRLR